MTHVRVPTIRLGAFLLVVLSCTVRAQPVCRVGGPDSVFFDKVAYNAYLPGSFVIHVSVFNPDVTDVDSVVVFARSNQRFTIVAPATKLIADKLRPGDTVHTSFTLIVNPRETNGIDTVTVAVSGKAGARSDCVLPIWVEKEYRPKNVIICPPDSNYRIVFVDSLNSYVPDPFSVPITVFNFGDAPSKETRILYVATPGLAPADGQDPILDVGTVSASGGRVDRTFSLRPLRRLSDTTVTLRFRVQGKGGLGDRIIDTLCSITIRIPAARDVEFSVQCRNDITIRFENGEYNPNPFTWTAHAKNTGNAIAKNVRMFVTLPPSCRLDSGSRTEVFFGSMGIGEERSATWTVMALPRDSQDTSIICTHVLDEYNRTATCCDTLIIPAMRRARLNARCAVIPDSVFVNPSTGEYQPKEFEVRLEIQNEGTETADSLVAELSLSDPDIMFVAPSQPVQFIAAKLAPQGFITATWLLAPLPSSVERNVAASIRLRSIRSAEIISHCTVFVSAALVPALECAFHTIPADTLHYDPVTFVHDTLIVSATVRSAGAIGVRNVQATLLLPAFVSLGAGEVAIKSYTGGILQADSSWTVTWKLLPLRQQQGVLDSIGVEFRGDDARAICNDWIFVVGIPPLTVLRIPANVVDRFAQRVKLPILIDNTDRKSIRDLDISIEYDASKVEFLGYDRAGSMLDSTWDFQSITQAGRIRFTASSSGGYLQGEGTLVFLDFLVTFGYGDDQLRVSGTAMHFDSLASLVNVGAVRARFYDGFLWTSGDCLWPLNASDNYLVVSAKPNPFNPSTTIRYVLPDDTHVRLTVIDMFGRYVVTIVDETQAKGVHEALFSGSDLPSGVYLCLLEAAGKQRSIRLALIK